MESPDVGSPIGPPHPEQTSPPATPQIVDGDADLWTQFAQAATVEAFCRSWLALQCRMIPGVAGGLVLLGPPDRGPFSPTAVWPSPRRSMKHLTEASQRALTDRRGLLIKRDPNGVPGAPARERYDVAYPIEVGGRLHGVVVLDVAPRPERDLQTVVRRLQWGFGWLELLFRREEAHRDAAIKERMQAVHDLIATALGHGRACAAAMAVVTAVAPRLGCDRVSLGFVRGGRVHPRAVSHSAQFGKQTNLIRAIGQAMDEAFDQRAVVVYPSAPGGAVRVTLAQAELARQHRAGAICSVPLSAAGAVVRRAAVAPFNGYIAEAPVRAGDLVRANQLLCALDDREMKLERLKWLSQQEQLVKQFHEAMAKHNAAQVTILTAQIEQAKAQVALLDDQLAHTRVLAPFDGVVVTGDLSQSLGAPIERGQGLFEVAPVDP